jgi:fructoselysine 6-kinase
MIKLIGLGDNTVDTYIHKNMRFPGGNAVNVSVLAHRNGAEAAYLGWLGDDPNGHFLFKALQEEGLDVSHCRMVAGANSVSSVSLLGGDRVFGKSKPGVTPQIELNAEDFAYLGRFDVVHTSAFSHLERFLVELRRAVSWLSFDFSHRQAPEYLQATLPLVDMALLSCPDPTGLEARFRMIHALGPRLVLITSGKLGAWVSDGKKVYHQGVKPVEVVDTLGAGDAFMARFLVEFTCGTSLRQAMNLAAESAALNCQHYGAFGHGESIS